jgi:hypothetical protein
VSRIAIVMHKKQVGLLWRYLRNSTALMTLATILFLFSRSAALTHGANNDSQCSFQSCLAYFSCFLTLSDILTSCSMSRGETNLTFFASVSPVYFQIVTFSSATFAKIPCIASSSSRVLMVTHQQMRSSLFCVCCFG